MAGLMGKLRNMGSFIAVKEICDGFGVPFEVVQGGKHAKVKFQIGVESFSIIVPVTSKNRRLYCNTRTIVRRLLRKRKIVVADQQRRAA